MLLNVFAAVCILFLLFVSIKPRDESKCSFLNLIVIDRARSGWITWMDFKEAMKCLVNVNLSGPWQRNSPTREAQVNGSAPDGSCTDGSETGSLQVQLV